MPAVAITDHGNAAGLMKLKKACDKAEIKPLYGIEFYCAPTSRLIKAKVDDWTKASYHLTCIAKNEIGLKNIFKLTSESWKTGVYSGRSRIDDDLLEQYHEGLIILSGCSSGKISQFLLEDKFQEAADYTKWLRNIFKDDFYIEIQNHGIEWQPKLKAMLTVLSEKYDIPLVATQDSHYQNQEDSLLHSHICKLTSGDLQFSTDQTYFKSREEMEKMFDPSEYHALDRTLEIADKCNVNWEYGKTIWPVYNLPDNRTPEQELRDLTYEGFNKLFPNPTDEYKDRIEYELKVIIEMGFPSYFLVVQDFINWGKKQGIPFGPGRGSAAGSLVCYCLGITTIDPIKYNLLFERMLNPGRIGSLCDIDTDICKSRRQEVVDYVSNKYGTDRVTQIGTSAEFKPKGALRDFARTSGYEPKVGEQLAAMIPAAIAGKEHKWKAIVEINPAILKTEYPQVVELAQKAEGLKKQVGIHAAGIIIADRPMTDYIPLYCGKHGEVASQFDMKEVEQIGLVKFDFLGLKNLTVIADTIKAIENNYNTKIDLYSLEDRDLETYKLFQNGNLDGIFQFETSSGFKELCQKVKPECIQDLAAISSLFRPGPIGAKLLDKYIECRQGKEPEYLIPELEPILKDTYATLIYQEQIMRICVDLAGYSLGEADDVRKLLGKKLIEKIPEAKEKFVNACIKNGFDKTKVEILFDNIANFALYCFNMSHAVAYSTTSYYTGWLKAHYPKEFYLALFNTSLESPEDLIKYTHSARERDIPLALPDINRSDSKFKLDNGTIVFGLSAVKGIGEKACEHILSCRPKDGFKSIQELISHKINRQVMFALAECGALDSLL